MSFDRPSLYKRVAREQEAYYRMMGLLELEGEEELRRKA